MLLDVVPDELDQHVGHLLALSCRGGFEGVVQSNFNVQIHALDLALAALFALLARFGLGRCGHSYAHLPER